MTDRGPDQELLIRKFSFQRFNRQRLTHWGINLRSLRYEIFPIDGETNYIADIGSRWGNPFADDEVKLSAEKGPRTVTKAFMRKSDCGKARSKCVLRIPQPKVHDNTWTPDIDAQKDLMSNMDTRGVNLHYIREHQDKYRRSRPKGLKVGKGKVWRDAGGRIWVPKRAKQLKNVLYAVAHQGPHLHRGYAVTLGLLQPHFAWDNLEVDVKARHIQCLLCIKAASGEMVPRPMGTQLIAEYPGEVLMADYILVWPSEYGHKYVLMMADKMSRLTQFIVCKCRADTTAVPACRGVIDWGSKYGLPEWLISDGGKHFNNHAMELLADMMGIEHHITLAHCPWANGSIEVVGRALLRSIRVLLSEKKLGLEKWEDVLPLINFGLSHMNRPVLGGRTPLEVMTGRKPKSAVDLVLWCGKYLKDATSITANLDMVKRHCEDLAKALDVIHTDITDKTMLRLRKQCAKEAKDKHKGAFAFSVGDLVMVAGTGNSANVTRKAKIMMKWQGPYQIVRRISNSQFDVLLLGSPAGTEKPVHWTRMKRFGGRELGEQANLVAGAQHDQQKFYIEDFEDWRRKGDGDIELLVQWRGLEATWEPVRQLYEDVPERVVKFLREHADEDPALKELHAEFRSAATATSTATRSRTTGRGRGRGSNVRGRGGRGRGRGRGRGGRGRGRGGRGRGRGGREKGRGGHGRGGRTANGRGRGGRGSN